MADGNEEEENDDDIRDETSPEPKRNVDDYVVLDDSRTGETSRVFYAIVRSIDYVGGEWIMDVLICAFERKGLSGIHIHIYIYILSKHTS